MESIFTSPEFQMSLLLFVALGGYLIASRINQSAVIGLILVGIVVGPSMLGWITYTDFVAVWRISVLSFCSLSSGLNSI